MDYSESADFAARTQQLLITTEASFKVIQEDLHKIKLDISTMLHMFEGKALGQEQAALREAKLHELQTSLGDITLNHVMVSGGFGDVCQVMFNI